MKAKFTRAHIESLGFGHFSTVSELRAERCRSLLKEGGVYIVVRDAAAPPVFLTTSPGGWFKGKDPTVPTAVLEGRWLSDTPVLYIGKATSLRDRVGQLLRFGAGGAIGHSGGRLLWQVADSDNFLLGWMAADAPRAREAALLLEFEQAHGRLPLANLQH